MVRVGISTGDAVSEDGDYYGEPVVEAARPVHRRRARSDPHHRAGADAGRQPQPASLRSGRRR